MSAHRVCDVGKGLCVLEMLTAAVGKSMSVIHELFRHSSDLSVSLTVLPVPMWLYSYPLSLSLSLSALSPTPSPAISQITQLKIDHNPFAKGFRDNYDT